MKYCIISLRNVPTPVLAKKVTEFPVVSKFSNFTLIRHLNITFRNNETSFFKNSRTNPLKIDTLILK